MIEPKTTCRACGAAILVQTAEATGGYCRSNRCARDREASSRAERERAIIGARVSEGTLQPCPLCGNLIRASRLTKHTEQKCERLSRPHPYATVLPHMPIPDWLKALSDARTLPPLIPIKDILHDSCFYPSSGLDSSPVLIANGCVHSFVYVDYGTSRDDYDRTMLFPGFRPYNRILSRNVERDEIVPDGLTVQAPVRFDNPGFDGQQRLMEAQSRCRFFCHWSIWQRRQNRDERDGPLLFSFLFLSEEAVAAYEEIYRRNVFVPKIIAIIQPGHACGDNWTNFNDPDAPLWKTVQKGRCCPEFLLLGSYGARSISVDCAFPGYTFVKKTYTYEDRTERVIGIYKKNT